MPKPTLDPRESAGMEPGPIDRPARAYLLQVAAFALGLVVAWEVTGEAWIHLGLEGLWLASAACVGLAILATVWRNAWGLASGLVVSATVCCAVFTFFSYGSGLID
jgi:hypothetical protein